MVVQFEQLLAELPNTLSKEHPLHVIAAVSGGVDSIVMLDMLVALRQRRPFTLAVAHFNHNLRKESTADASFVKKTAKTYGLPLFTSSGDVRAFAKKKKVSIEMAARTMRYDFFRDTLRTSDFTVIATAHTMNDQEETVLLNLLRGTGIAGMAGIPPVRELVKNKFIIRPMLTLAKDELCLYAKTKGLKWREDRTNTSLEIPRNYVRATVTPLLSTVNPKHLHAVSRAAKITRELMTTLRPQIETTRKRFIKTSIKGDTLSIARAMLLDYFSGLCALALQEAFEETFGIVLTYADIEAICQLAKRQTGVHLMVNGNVCLTREREEIVAIQQYREISKSSAVRIGVNETGQIGNVALNIRDMPRRTVSLGKSPLCEYIDAHAAGDSFTLRPWKAGDRFIPLGSTSHKKISDFLTDRKAPTTTKKNALVLCSQEHIVWVCGMQIDNRVRISRRTKHILELSMQNI